VLNIVIPMAGRGSRFAVVGYSDPKPLIPIHGTPMIRVVIENLTPPVEHRFVFVCQRDHVAEYRLDELLPKWAPGSVIVPIDGVTEGAACTVLAARDFIDNDDELIIANSDQYVAVDIADYVAALDERGLNGLIMTMFADDPKWSFVETDADGLVRRVVEKEVISNEATVGIYSFARGADFVRAADAMIAADERVNGEFYVAPVYGQLIAEGASVGTLDVGGVGDGMYGLGTPQDLDAFLALPLSLEAAGQRA
jgi:NDP-sugar pyrophosphorylase family protein